MLLFVQSDARAGVDNGGYNGSREEPLEYPPSIFHELASSACEEDPSQQIETLLCTACRYSHVMKHVVLAGMAG